MQIAILGPLTAKEVHSNGHGIAPHRAVMIPTGHTRTLARKLKLKYRFLSSAVTAAARPAGQMGWRGGWALRAWPQHGRKAKHQSEPVQAAKCRCTVATGPNEALQLQVRPAARPTLSQTLGGGGRAPRALRAPPGLLLGYWVGRPKVAPSGPCAAALLLRLCYQKAPTTSSSLSLRFPH